MKHIKIFENFESISPEIINTLKDILCELTDDGKFDYNILANNSRYPLMIRIGRYEYLNNKCEGDLSKIYDASIFRVFEVRDIVLRIEKYLKSEGYSLLCKDNIGQIINFRVNKNCFLMWLVISKI